MCLYGINSTYLLPWQHKFLCHVDFVNCVSVFNNYKTIKRICFELHSSQIAAMKSIKNKQFKIQLSV